MSSKAVPQMYWKLLKMRFTDIVFLLESFSFAYARANEEQNGINSVFQTPISEVVRVLSKRRKRWTRLIVLFYKMS